MLDAVPISDSYHPIGERAVSGLGHPDCPDGVIVFGLYQKQTAGGMAVRMRRTVTGIAWCQATGDAIPAMAWTRDMERAFRRLRKVTPRKPTSFRFQRRFVIVMSILLVVLAALAVGAWYVLTQTEGRWSSDGGYGAAQARIAEVTEDPAPGDRLHVYENATAEAFVTRWYVVRTADGDGVTVQAYDEPSAVGTESADLDPDGFSGPTLAVDSERFAEGILAADGQMWVINDAVSADAPDD